MNPAILVGLLLLLPLFFLLVERSKRSKVMLSKKRFRVPAIPSPPKLPFIGNLHQLSLVPQRATWELSKQHGPLMMLQLGTVRAVVVSSSKLAEEFLRSQDICFASRPRLKAPTLLLYGGKEFAFAPYGEYWRQLRKLCITQLLSNKMVQSYAPLRSDEVTLMLKTIRSQGGAAFSMTRVLNSFANGVVCRAVLGSTMNEDRRRLLSELVRINAVLLVELFVEDFFPWLRWLDVLLGLEGKLKRHLKRWDDLLEIMIEEHNDSILKEKDAIVSFIDVLLDLQNNSSNNTKDLVLEREEIKATLMVMIIAGTDTTFGVLDWCMTELVRHPEVMKKLQNEIRSTTNYGEEQIVGEEHLSKMNYLKAVINEVLRLHPPTPMLLPRESIKDCQIEEYFIPKKTRVHINIFAIGRDPGIWERPEEFLPERFLDCPIDYKGHHFQFLPFGAGRRICPGLQFASKTIEHALANLLCFFDWKLPQGLKGEDMNMAEASGIVAQRKHVLELVAVPVKLT